LQGDYDAWSRSLGEALDGELASSVTCDAWPGQFTEGAQLPGAQFGELMVTELYVDSTYWDVDSQCGDLQVEVYNRTDEDISLDGSAIQAWDMTLMGPTDAVVPAHGYLSLSDVQVATAPSCANRDGNHPSSLWDLPTTLGVVAGGDVVSFLDPWNEVPQYWRLDPAYVDAPLVVNDDGTHWCSSATGSLGVENAACP
jgi:hypothetical protein